MRYDLRTAVCRIGKALHESGLNAGRAGNISARVDADTILVTPRGVRKDTLRPTDLVAVRIDEPDLPDQASTETRMHVAAYRTDRGIGALIHAHAPALTAAGLRGLDLADHLPEIDLAVGTITTVDFAPSGSQTLADQVGQAVAGGAAVVLLRRHGAVAVGADLDDAFDRLELAELSARAVLLAD